MLLFRRNLRIVFLAGAASAALASQASAGPFTVNPGATDNVAKTVHSGDTGTIGAGGTLTASTPITWSLTTAGTVPATINNSGTIRATGSSRGIDTSGSANGPQSFTLNNLSATSLLTSASDAFRVNGDIGAGTVTVDNFGTISATSTSGGRAISLNAGIVSSSSTVSVTNELGGLISAAGDDALRPGTGHVTITNSGTIQSTATGSTVGRAINLNLNATSSTDFSSLKSFSLTNNSTGLIQSPGDGVRISASTISTGATSNYVVSIDNFGSIKSTGTGANNGQAIDFNDLQSTHGSVTITNRASGILQAADADAIRPGNNSIVNNYGKISALNGTPTSSGNDGVDFQEANSTTGIANSGTVNNFSTGSIEGARHGITGAASLSIRNDGIITGNAGSGINIDSTTGTTIVINSATGVITGTIPAGAVGQDGDGIDIDHLANIDNSGQILARGTGSGSASDGPVLNEAVAVGGGIVINRQGGLIESDQRAITVDNSSGGNAFGATTIDNAGTITGKDGEAIRITSDSSTGNSLTNGATGIINGSVVMGSGNDTITLHTGSILNGALDGGGGNDTIHLTGTGNGSLSNVSNVATLNVDQGKWSLSGGQTYSGGTTVAAGATAIVSGALNGGVTNNGTVSVNNGTASFDGTFQNNGALVSDPAVIKAFNLSIGQNGYIAAAPGDLYQIGNNFTNQSTQNALWDTSGARLEFTGLDGTSHILELNGTDFGAVQGINGNFGWGGLDIDIGNILQLEGLDPDSNALYFTDLLGASVLGDTIANIWGQDGLTIYYDGADADNSYLHGLTYQLSGGGRLVAVVPEPETWTLFIAGFGLLGAVMRRKRGLPGSAR